MEVDDSAGHAKLRTSVFFTQFMDVTWGGAKGTKMRSTAATSECLVLGAAEKTVTSQGREHACKLKKKTGDTQHVCLKPSDAPPFCDLDVPPRPVFLARRRKATLERLSTIFYVVALESRRARDRCCGKGTCGWTT